MLDEKQISSLETPCIVIDVDLARKNIQAMQERVAAAHCRLRPHIKTHKMPLFSLMQIEAGADGITCAKVSEAEVMADGGCRDIFIAYPMVGRARTERAIALSRRVDRLILAVDSLEGAKMLSDAAVAAGVTLDQLARALGHDRKIIRAMPNTPALVNAGMTSVTPNALVTPEDTADVLNIFRCFGEAEVIAEPMIHPVVGVSGSSPAYVFMFIEAMADAAVLGGMPRAQAYKFAAQAVMGSAKMVLETGEHPGALKDMVCSPGGTTIEAVRVLEEKGFRAAVIEAMTKCMEKSEKLSKS